MTPSEVGSTGRTAKRVVAKLMGLEFRDPGELAAILKEENAQFSGRDLIAFGRILATRFPQNGNIASGPEWLTEVLIQLVDSQVSVICDPWAGIGLLLGALREATNANTAIAIGPNQSQVALGKVLVPQADWKVGCPVQVVASIATDLDLVASILPMNVRAQQPLTVTLPSGGSRGIGEDVGSQLLVATSMRLSPSGLGLFVVTPSAFFAHRSVLRELSDFGIGIEAAFYLPSGTFAPFTTIPGYLVVIRRRAINRMFVAQLSADTKTNSQIIANFKQGLEGGALELGRFVDSGSFRGIEALRASESVGLAEKQFGVQASALADMADVKSGITLGRPGDQFAFHPFENAIYVPLIGNSDVVESPAELTLKAQNYAQVVIDPQRSDAQFVARFLNSEIGKRLREQSQSGFIPRFNKQTLRALPVLIPSKETQHQILDVETRIITEQNTILALQNEISDLRRELWRNPNAASTVKASIDELALRLAGGITQHASSTLEQWFETLPFPLASILRAWQATPSREFKAKYEHLLHFFEGAAQFIGIILLSAFSSNEAVFSTHRQKLTEAMKKQNLSFTRATFGTWKLVVEYLGKQTRELLDDRGKSAEEAKNDRALCADMFADPSLSLPQVLSNKELAATFSTTNKMRNDWSGHGGVVGHEEARLRNQRLLGEVQKLREVISDIWSATQMIHALNCRPQRGIFENEVAVLVGSNSEFLKETRVMGTWLDVERLYLCRQGATKALKLLPLIHLGTSPQSAKNACYFFSRLESHGARFVSYHFTEMPELTTPLGDASTAIEALTEP